MNVELNKGDTVRIIVGQFKNRTANVITTYDEYVVIEVKQVKS